MAQALAALLILVALDACAAKSSTSTPPPSSARVPASQATVPSSQVPITREEADDIRQQIEQNWNMGALAECSFAEQDKVEIRIHLDPDGTVTKAEALTPTNDDCAKLAVNSAIRATMIASPLKVPPSRYWPSMVLVFNLAALTQ